MDDRKTLAADFALMTHRFVICAPTTQPAKATRANDAENNLGKKKPAPPSQDMERVSES